MLLSILIPTYNRADYLEKNLCLLEKYIVKNNLSDEVKIIVSDNCSDDNTKKVLTRFLETDEMKIDIYHQDNNLGLEQNVLFVLNKAKSEYTMILGDDDYLNEKYLVNIIDKLKTDHDIYCIIPSIQSINHYGDIINSGRDLNIESKIYKKGFNNCLNNSWRAHQISGLTFKREMTLASYEDNKVSNIYPQIYFIAYNCLRGKTWHFTDYPVRVTVTEQKNKDWGYKDDGLISEIFDNYKKINELTLIQRSKLELKLLNVQNSRYQMYLTKGITKYLKALKNIEFGENTSLLTSFCFPILVFKHLSKLLLTRFLDPILSNNK